MKRIIAYHTLALCLFCLGGTIFSPLNAQLCNWLQVQVGQVLTGSTLSVFVKPNLDVNTLPCTIWSTGSQITLRWPAVTGSNPVTGITINNTTMGFAQNTGLGIGGAIGSDGGDGYYYIQFTNSGSNQQSLFATSNHEIFNLTFTSTSIPLVEFVSAGATTIFGNTDPAFWMGGQNVFDSFIPNNAFPVEWTHFSARGLNGNEVELNWGTAVEINNDYFQVEKSVDGQVFETISQVQGAGNTNEKQEYFYVDRKYVSDRVFYRLKQVDKNGTYEYSDIEEVRLDNSVLSDLTFEVSPNPASEFVNFKLQGSAMGVYDLWVVDGMGKEVMRERFDLEDGVFTMQVGHLSKGMYYASLISKEGEQYSVGRFLKP